MKERRLSRAEELKAAHMAGGGWSLGAIANALGVGPECVRSFLRRNALPLAPKTPNQVACVVTMRASTWGRVAALSHTLGVTEPETMLGFVLDELTGWGPALDNLARSAIPRITEGGEA